METNLALKNVFTGRLLDFRSVAARSQLEATLESLAHLAGHSEGTPEFLAAVLPRLGLSWRQQTSVPLCARGKSVVIHLDAGLRYHVTGEPVLLQLLVQRPYQGPFAYRLLSARTADAAGRSLVGIYDLPLRVRDRDLLYRALGSALGRQFDTREFGARLIEAYEAARIAGETDFRFDFEELAIRVAPEADPVGWWRLFICRGEDEAKTLSDFLPEVDPDLDLSGFFDQLHRLQRLARRTRVTIDAFPDILHLLRDHVERFPARLKDPSTGFLHRETEVRDAILAAAERAIETEDFGRVFYRFPEAGDGDRQCDRAQLAVPVVLPGAEKGAAELYLVFRLGVDSDGLARLEIPTVLTQEMVQVNLRVMKLVRRVLTRRENGDYAYVA